MTAMSGNRPWKSQCGRPPTHPHPRLHPCLLQRHQPGWGAGVLCGTSPGAQENVRVADRRATAAGKISPRLGLLGKGNASCISTLVSALITHQARDVVVAVTDPVT